MALPLLPLALLSLALPLLLLEVLLLPPFHLLQLLLLGLLVGMIPIHVERVPLWLGIWRRRLAPVRGLLGRCHVYEEARCVGQKATTAAAAAVAVVRGGNANGGRGFPGAPEEEGGDGCRSLELVEVVSALHQRAVAADDVNALFPRPPLAYLI
jgi:hypothetical protein